MAQHWRALQRVGCRRRAAFRPTAGTQIALAYRNADVQRLNLNIRGLPRDTDRLQGVDALYRARDVELAFAASDRVLFLETSKVGAVQVDNGALGTAVTAANALTVRLDSGSLVSITPETYAAVSHGYAATIHKSQGATVDTAHVLVTSGMDRHKAYVAFSRHRTSLTIYVPQDQLRGNNLAVVLARSDDHANAVATGPFRERRGIDAMVSARERAQTTLATRRLLVSDAWNRLEDAAAVAFARTAREVKAGDAVFIRQDLLDIGYLPAVAAKFAGRMAQLMGHRLRPAAIAHVMVPKEHPLSSTIWATLRAAARRTYAGVAKSSPSQMAGLSVDGAQAQQRWTHTTLDADAAHWRLSFAYHAGAVHLMAEAGFTFDTASKAWLQPLNAPLPDAVMTRRAAIEALLAQRAARVSAMAEPPRRCRPR